MSVKFKIGFTIAAETLFELMSKMLPIEDLEVEELKSRFETTLAQRAIAVHKPKPQVNKRGPKGPSLDRGINGIIMTALSDGPKRASQIQPKVKAAGYSANSLTSRLEALLHFDVIERAGNGLWRKK